jgi:nucleoid DNA-binding protein
MKTADLIEHVAAEHGVAKEHTKKILDSALAAVAAAANRAPAPVESTKKRGSLSQKPSPKTSERKGRRQGRIEA